MKIKQTATLFQYLILAIVMVLPGFAFHARATDGSKTDPDMIGNALPPIDRNPPKVFETVSFGLG